MNVRLLESRPDRDARVVLGDIDELQAVCHDLRGHLASIAMIASALCAERSASGTRPSKDSGFAGALMDEVDLTTELVRRVTSGLRDVTQVDLATLTQSSVARAQLGSLCRMTCTATALTVDADRLHLSRVLDNLLENAVQAAGRHGTVDVTLEKRRHASRTMAALTVADSGPGFGRLPSRPGSLGLTIVRALVREAAGSLSIGRSAGGGGMVTVLLPLARS